MKILFLTFTVCSLLIFFGYLLPRRKGEFDEKDDSTELYLSGLFGDKERD